MHEDFGWPKFSSLRFSIFETRKFHRRGHSSPKALGSEAVYAQLLMATEDYVRSQLCLSFRPWSQEHGVTSNLSIRQLSGYWGIDHQCLYRAFIKRTRER